MGKDNSGEPVVTMRAQIAVDSMNFYVQQIMLDHFDEIKAKIQSQIAQQFKEMDLEKVIEEAMEDIVKKTITDDVQAAWREAWWNKDSRPIRDKVRKAMAECIAETLVDKTFEG